VRGVEPAETEVEGFERPVQVQQEQGDTVTDAWVVLAAGIAGDRGGELAVVVAVVVLQDAFSVLDGRLVIAGVGSTEDDIEQQAYVTLGLDETPEVAVDLRGGLEAVLAIEPLDRVVTLGHRKQ
jgi:hypothetical protein